MEGVIVLPPQNSTFYFTKTRDVATHDTISPRRRLAGVVRKQAIRPLNIRRRNDSEKRSSFSSARTSLDTTASSQAAPSISIFPSVSESRSEHRQQPSITPSASSDPIKTSTLTVPNHLASVPGGKPPPSPTATFHSVGSRAQGISNLPSSIAQGSALNDLFNNICCRYLLPILDLSIPQHTDAPGALPLTYRDEFFNLSLQHLPLFWALMLCASTIAALDDEDSPDTSPMASTFQHLASRSLNTSMESVHDNASLCTAVLCATATVAAWERIWGSSAKWKVHCRSFDILVKQHPELDQRHIKLARNLLLGGMDSILKHGRSQRRSAIQNVIREVMVPMPAGFDALRNSTDFHHEIFYSICDLAHLDRDSFSPSSTHMLRSCAAQLVDLDIQAIYGETIARRAVSTRDADRRLLEMLTLVQYTGLCLVSFLGTDVDIPDITNIAFDRLYTQAVRLARNVARESAYEEVALWALWTITVTMTVSGGAYRRLREDPRDLRKIIVQAGVGCWEDMESVLHRHLYPRSIISLSRGYWTLLDLDTLGPGARES